jgi:Fe-S-cluster containining protein
MPILPELEALLVEMDNAYRETAERYGFVCSGCADSCCRSLFYHHTFLEYFYIREGYLALESEPQARIIKRARTFGQHPPADTGRNQKVRGLCPLNFDERCILYTHRPMICRLHGIPHEFQRPDGKIINGSGCQVFSENHEQKDSMRLNRTPFYFALAVLENKFKLSAGITQKMKMTVTEIICSFDGQVA